MLSQPQVGAFCKLVGGREGGRGELVKEVKGREESGRDGSREELVKGVVTRGRERTTCGGRDEGTEGGERTCSGKNLVIKPFKHKNVIGLEATTTKIQCKFMRSISRVLTAVH